MKTLLLLLFPLCLSAQQVIYVNQAASGNNNGSNWQDAFTDLQDALAIANYADQIWVAQGTYFPTSGLDRNSTFFIPYGVSIWGGFIGTETNKTERDVDANPSILSGNIGLPNDNTDNCYHVVLIHGGDTKTGVDGFTITAGYADGSVDGGILSKDRGAGILVVADDIYTIAEPIISHCVFIKNWAYNGGGIACHGSNDYMSIPVVSHCKFIQNTGLSRGGGLYKEGINLDGKSFKIENCLFEGNYAQGFGGGLSVKHSSGLLQILKCSFERDTGLAEGGAIFFGTGDFKIRYEIDSCQIKYNYSESGGPGVSQFPTAPFIDTVKLIVKNTAFLANFGRINTGGGVISSSIRGLHFVSIEHCVFEGNYTSTGSGTGVYISSGPLSKARINIDRCLFVANGNNFQTPSTACYIYGRGEPGDPNQYTLSNSVFLLNDAVLGLSTTFEQIHFINCSFYKNGLHPFDKIYQGAGDTNIELLNCVIWELDANKLEETLAFGGSTNDSTNRYKLEHSLINLPTCEYNGYDPCGEGMIYAQYPDFVDPVLLSNLELLPGSVAQNKGSNQVIDTFGLTKDYLGNPRICGETVDMGAYEIQANCFSSSVYESQLLRLPVGLRILSNPVNSGSDIQAEVFAALPLTLSFTLFNVHGDRLFHTQQFISAGVPQRVSIPGNDLVAGIYLLQIVDENGRAKVEKIVVQ
ncbi:MAG: choice-of-anchor Q domain-containing protein [Saprospiraceae bacterium]